jgi:protein-disulfide isomerase
MVHKSLLLSILSVGIWLFFGGGVSVVAAQEQSSRPELDPGQVESIEQIIRDYLMENPEVIIEAVQAYQEKRKIAEQERQRNVVASMSSALLDDPDSPVIGNPDGGVALVEFFDYRCPYCKKIAPDLQEVLATQSDVRIIMKEYPILGPESVVGARAALAAARQDKYKEFHFALMASPGDMSERHILATAKQVGIDTDMLRKDMESDEIGTMLARNRDLASTLGITGTPALVIGDQVIPGAINLQTLLSLIAQERSNSS